MPLTLIKSLLWLLALGVFGVLGWALWDYKQHPELGQPTVTREHQKEILAKVPEPEPEIDDLADYARVTANFHKMKWTGELPPPPPKPVAQAVAAKPKVKPVAELLSVLYIQVDTRNAGNSVALVRFDDASLSKEDPDGQLRPGDALAAPHDHWVVQSIVAEEVVFEFTGESDDQEAGATESLQPPTPLESGIVIVGPDGELIMPPQDAIPQGTAPPVGYWPEFTIEMRPGYRRVGTVEAAQIGENYLDIIGEIRHRQYHDPRSGKWGGIEIQSVPSGSLAAQHGLKSGDIIKSINGNPVNSVQEAITFAKNNSDNYSVWTVVIENAGRERTETFETPQ